MGQIVPIPAKAKDDSVAGLNDAIQRNVQQPGPPKPSKDTLRMAGLSDEDIDVLEFHLFQVNTPIQAIKRGLLEQGVKVSRETLGNWRRVGEIPVE